MAELTDGQLAAARAFKAARGRKGMSQAATAGAAGVDRHVVVRFERGKTWPDARTQAKLEPVVMMPPGTLEDIAARYERGEVIAELLTQDQADALLERRQIEREALRRLVSLLRDAVAEKREMDAMRLTVEIEDILNGGSPE